MKATNGLLGGHRAGWLGWLAAVAAGMAGPGAAGAPEGDYGDAPDEGPTHYSLMFSTSSEVGHFPTLYNTTNGRLDPHGVCHLKTDEEWFGPMDKPPSRETDANDTVTDDDGWQNLINSDMRDNGLPKIVWVIALTQMAPVATFSFYVSVPEGAPDVDRVFNLLIDWDQDGRWKNMGPYGYGAIDEWAVRNQVVRVRPGETKLIESQPFLWGWHALLDPKCFWVRMTISQVGVPDPSPDGYGWDGSGVFPTGETEDYLFSSRYPRDVAAGPWDPGNASPPRPLRARGRQKVGGGGGGGGMGPPIPIPPFPPPLGRKPVLPALPVEVVIMPADQTVPHGTLAAAHVVKVPATTPPADPALPAWAVGPGWRNGGCDGVGSGLLPLMPPPGITSYPFGPFLELATFDGPDAGAPAGTLQTIHVSSVVDPRSPATEDWPLDVCYQIPGVISGTASGVVRVRHSDLYAAGVPVDWGISGVYTGGTSTISGSNIAEPQKTAAFTLLDGSRVDFEGGQLAAALAKLTDLRALLAGGLPGITPEEEARLNAVVGFLETEVAAIHAVHGAVPVPRIEWPADGGHVAGMIELLVTHLYPVGDVDRVAGEWRDPGTGSWLPLPLPAVNLEPPSNRWLQPVDTTMLPDGVHDVRVTLTDENADPSPDDDRMCRAVVALRVDNTPPPAPTLAVPPPGATVNGLLHVEATGGEGDACVGSVELRAIGAADWIEAATDYDGSDGWQFDVDMGALPGGPYEVRVVTSDAAENEAASGPLEVTLAPAYLAWRSGFDITDDGDDSDGDGIAAILEYYAGLNPQVREPAALLDFGIDGGAGGFFLHCARREHVAGLTCTVEASSDLGITDPWAPLAVDPPAGPPGRIEVALPDGERQFGRIRLEP